MDLEASPNTDRTQYISFAFCHDGALIDQPLLFGLKVQGRSKQFQARMAVYSPGTILARRPSRAHDVYFCETTVVNESSRAAFRPP